MWCSAWIRPIFQGVGPQQQAFRSGPVGAEFAGPGLGHCRQPRKIATPRRDGPSVAGEDPPLKLLLGGKIIYEIHHSYVIDTSGRSEGV